MPSSSDDLKKRMLNEKNNTHEVCTHISSDENTEVNVEVMGGAPELWVIGLTVTVVTPVIAAIGVVVGVVGGGGGFAGCGGGFGWVDVEVVEVYEGGG